MSPQLVTLPLEIQIALGCGWLAYTIGHAGLDARHRATDVALRTLLFGLPAAAIARATLGREDGTAWTAAAAIGAAVAVSVLLGAFWRAVGRRGALWLVRAARVHRDDGLDSAWTALIHEDREVITGAVELTDGTRLYTGDRRDLDGYLWAGLNLGADGSVVMIAKKQRLPGSDAVTARGTAIDTHTARYTYIPAARIASVDLRYMMPPPKV